MDIITAIREGKSWYNLLDIISLRHYCLGSGKRWLLCSDIRQNKIPPPNHSTGSLEHRRLKENSPLLPRRSIWPKHFPNRHLFCLKHVFSPWTTHLNAAKAAPDVKATQTGSSLTTQGCWFFQLGEKIRQWHHHCSTPKLLLGQKGSNSITLGSA